MPSAEEMEQFGFTEDDFASDAVDIFPDNLLAFNVFSAISTQWRHGMSGVTGLDYGSLPDIFRMMAISRSEWPDLFSDIRTMEHAALVEISKK